MTRRPRHAHVRTCTKQVNGNKRSDNTPITHNTMRVNEVRDSVSRTQLKTRAAAKCASHNIGPRTEINCAVLRDKTIYNTCVILRRRVWASRVIVWSVWTFNRSLSRLCIGNSTHTARSAASDVFLIKPQHQQHIFSVLSSVNRLMFFFAEPPTTIGSGPRTCRCVSTTAMRRGIM